MKLILKKFDTFLNVIYQSRNQIRKKKVQFHILTWRCMNCNIGDFMMIFRAKKKTDRIILLSKQKSNLQDKK